MLSLVSELWTFMRVRKKFWLLPILIVLGLFGVLIVLAQGSAHRALYLHDLLR